MIEKRPAFKLGTETAAILERLLRAEIGELVTYQQLLDLTGFQTVDRMRGCLSRALRNCWRKQIYFRTERGSGILRVDGNGAVDRTSRREEKLARFRRRVRREWGSITDALSSDKMSIRTRAMIRHDMLDAIEKLYRKPSFVPPVAVKEKVDPSKIVALFEKKKRV